MHVPLPWCSNTIIAIHIVLNGSQILKYTWTINLVEDDIKFPGSNGMDGPIVLRTSIITPIKLEHLTILINGSHACTTVETRCLISGADPLKKTKRVWVISVGFSCQFLKRSCTPKVAS